MLLIIAVACAVGAWAAQPASNVAKQTPLQVATSSELLAALQPANAGRRIDLAAGEYAVDRPLVVPDAVTLAGAGVMTFDGNGLPAGFERGTVTTLRVTTAFDGNVLTLGNGSRLERLQVVDLEAPSVEAAQRRGNVVQVASRAPGDTIDASVTECELINPNGVDFTNAGPVGHGVAVLTLNPNLEAPPAAHEGARVSVQLQRSIVRTDSGAVVFSNNFATRGWIAVRLVGNRFEGRLVAVGGTSRRESVREAATRIESRDNLYAVSGFERHGWNIMGASSSPHFADLPGSGAARNLLRVESSGDRIDGFHVGIQASAARRVGVASQLLNDNRLELHLDHTHIRTNGQDAADLQLWAAWSEIAQGQGPGEFPAGDRNVLRARIEEVSGSGRRRNAYAAAYGPETSDHRGVGNRLEIEGGRDAFIESNRDLEPPPAAEFFLGNATRARDPGAAMGPAVPGGAHD